MFKRGTLAKEIEDKTFAMKSGEVTEVISREAGLRDSESDRSSDGRHPPIERC